MLFYGAIFVGAKGQEVGCRVEVRCVDISWVLCGFPKRISLLISGIYVVDELRMSFCGLSSERVAPLL